MSYPARVQYREGQRLRAADLRGEQEYLLGLAGRHYVSVHDWGIVRGLEVTFKNGVVDIYPGVAIDGYGRELVLPERVSFDLGEPPPHQWIYLHYCQRAQGSCGSGTNKGWRDAAEIIFTDSPLEIPHDMAQLDDARAAGILNAPPWPIFLAIINPVPQANGEIIDATSRKFTEVSTSRIVSPSSKSLVRLGREHFGDLHQFRVSILSATGVLRDRFTIDLDGNIQITGDLVLTGAELQEIVFAFRSARVVLQPSRSLGSSLTRRNKLEIENGESFLVIELRDPNKRAQQFRIPISGDDLDTNDPQALLQPGIDQLASINIEATRTVQPAPVTPGTVTTTTNDPHIRKSPTLDSLVRASDNIERALKYKPTIIGLEREISIPKNQCGCADDLENRRRVIPRIEFVGYEKAPQTTTRDIYTLKKVESGRNKEELRISLGAFSEGDFRRHFSVGMRNKTAADPFTVFMKVRGDGAFELEGGDETREDRPDMMIVHGTITLPPVKPDPRDPLFKSLLQLTFLEGVLSHGASSLVTRIAKLPTLVETGQPWQYDIQLENVGGQPLVNPTGQEIFNSSVLNPHTIPNLPSELVNGTPQTITVEHKGSELPEASSLIIRVIVGMDLKTDHRRVAAQAHSGITTIVKTPSINLAGLNRVPAGASFPLVIKNEAHQRLRIPSRTIQVVLPTQTVTLNLEADSADPDQNVKTTDRITIPTDVKSFKVEASFQYNWPERETLSTMTVSRTLKVQKQFSSAIETNPSPPPANAPWKYDLKIKNHSSVEITLKLLKLRSYLDGSPSPLPPFTEFALDEVLKTQETFVQTNLTGNEGPNGSSVIVELELSYVRASVVWENVPRTLKIPIP